MGCGFGSREVRGGGCCAPTCVGSGVLRAGTEKQVPFSEVVGGIGKMPDTGDTDSAPILVSLASSFPKAQRAAAGQGAWTLRTPKAPGRGRDPIRPS